MNCPACGAAEIKDGKIYNGYQLKRCTQCNLVFTAERNFSTAHYDDVYSGLPTYRMMLNDARQTFEGSKGYRELWWFKRKALKWLKERRPNGRLLDVGSGPGTFLMVAKNDFGYAIQGVEPASIAAKAANDFGVPTYCGALEDFAKQNPGTFDAITSFEVLEHVPDPLTVLVTAKSLLKKDGLLVLSVPNLDDPYLLDQTISVTMPPIHINFFSRKSLSRVLQRAGFEIDRTYTLPIPSSSVRNIHGRNGFLLRLPYISLQWLMRRMDGTTLLAVAKAS